nr:hypothetical protein [Polymorphobacter sp.]
MHDYIWGAVWVLIPLTAILSGVVKRWLTFKERQLDTTAKVAGEQAAQYAAKIERLEAHVAVLNRIVTDRGTYLAAEIDDLRTPASKLN